jgi:hypothetical protein
MTDTMTSQNIVLSSWDTPCNLIICYWITKCVQRFSVGRVIIYIISHHIIFIYLLFIFVDMESVKQSTEVFVDIQQYSNTTVQFV